MKLFQKDRLRSSSMLFKGTSVLTPLGWTDTSNVRELVC